MTFRRLLFWLHLCTGAVVGLVIAFLAVTGCILSFQPQIMHWAERRATISSPTRSACVDPSVLLGNAVAYQHDAPASLTLYSDPHQPAEIAFSNNTVVLSNACTGTVIAHGAEKLRGFFLAVRDLHRWIAWNGVRHETLRAIKNACVLAFLFLILSGLVLWFPRKISWKHFRPSIILRSDLRGRAREWNWHNVFGFWMSILLAVIALTGTIMAYGWANTLLYRAAGSPSPMERAAEPKRPKPLGVDKFPSLDQAIKAAIAQDPQWKSILMRIPSQKDPNVTFTIDEGDGGNPQLRAQLVVVRKDGQVVRWEPFSANPRGRQWRLYARFLHTGEIFGVVGRAIAALAMISALVLVWTGFSLVLRRLFSWKKRRTDRLSHEAANKHAKSEEDVTVG